MLARSMVKNSIYLMVIRLGRRSTIAGLLVGWQAIAAGCLAAVISPSSAAEAITDEENPFTLSVRLEKAVEPPKLVVRFGVPPHHYLYPKELAFELDGRPLTLPLPAPHRVMNKTSAGQKLVLDEGFETFCSLGMSRSKDVTFSISFRGCNDQECYFPETRHWLIREDNVIIRLDDTTGNAFSAGKITDGFRIVGRASGFLASGKFLRFLGGTLDAGVSMDQLGLGVAGWRMFATLAMIVAGGLALNLTPCVLPMIPINLAILGIGARNHDRRRGFLLGGAYGAGMALAYGTLGLAVVLTGAKFGALNSSPWFNFAIAVVFLVLALAMFDLLVVDLSRFQRPGIRGDSRGALIAAVSMGIVSALLAGACVAPVLISVLFLATTLYQQGSVAGLLLPFLLGAGMALPWPFAGAGLSFLPKPGVWMTKVKHAFGVLIIGFAAWYGWLGYGLTSFGSATMSDARASERSVRDLRAALERSRATHQPVVIDFWASWCKNCAAMEHSTFQDPVVRQRLNDFLLVKFQAERLTDAAIKPVLDEFGVIGLPTYLVLVPDKAESRAQTGETVLNR